MKLARYAWFALGLPWLSVYAQQGTLKVGGILLPQNTWLLNQSDSDAGPELDYKTTFGFAGGLTTTYNFTDNIGIGLDVLFSREGQRYEGREDEATLKAQTLLNYLKVPLLFRFNSDPNSSVQLSFFIGPQANFLLAYRDKLEVTGGGGSFIREAKGTTVSSTLSFAGYSETEEEKLSAGAYRSFVFGGVFGLGAGFKLTDEVLLSINFRADYTFGDVENKEAKIIHDNDEHEYWENEAPKYVGSNPPKKRPATAALTGGLMVGVTYSLPLR
ncbi:MAG: porin family protein [Bacteroidia bacterium]|nr:porin family protein [Bacteroidia bacterium]